MVSTAEDGRRDQLQSDAAAHDGGLGHLSLPRRTRRYNPNDPSTFPFQFDVTVGPPGVEGFDVYSRDRRYYLFFEDKWRVTNNVTLNLGLLL